MNLAEKCTRTTFCNQSFDLSSLQEAITKGGKKSAVAWNNWNSRPGFSFIKYTLSMNAPGESPYVSDTKFSYRIVGNTYDMEGYGPYNDNILRNWVRKGRKRCSTPPFDSDL